MAIYNVYYEEVDKQSGRSELCGMIYQREFPDYASALKAGQEVRPHHRIFVETVRN